MSGYVYKRRNWLARAWDWLRGSRTYVGVDVATGPDYTVITTARVRTRRDGVRVLEVVESHRVD